MKLNGEEGTDQPLVNGCCQEVARTEESPGEEAGEEGAKNDKEIVLIQDMGFNVQIQIPGGNPIELPVRPQLSHYHRVLLCSGTVVSGVEINFFYHSQTKFSSHIDNLSNLKEN